MLSRQVYSRGVFIGVSSSLVKVIMNEKKLISISGNGFCMCIVIDGMISDGSRFSVENIVIIMLLNVGVLLVLIMMCGSQVNIEQVISDVMLNISVMFQFSDVCQIFLCGCVVGLVVLVSGFGVCLVSISYGSVVVSVSSVYMFSDICQFVVLVIGIVSSVGSIVFSCSMLMQSVFMVLILLVK